MAAVVPSVLKGLLLVILWGLFVFWVVEWFLYPTDRWTSWKANAIGKTNSKFLEMNGPYYLMWSFPLIMFALFALMYMELDEHYTKRELRTKVPVKGRQIWRRISRGMWNQPILVKTPLGVLTGMDLLAISLVLLGTFWILFKPLVPALQLVDQSKMKPGIERWMIKVGRVGTWTGRAWYLPMALLFIPVSRSSPFLRLINMPSEHAVRYHRWLGHFSLVILLLHSITFSLHLYYTSRGSMQGIFQWKYYGVSNLAGVISMLAGIIMWVTSLEPVHVFFFDVFYTAHHLYVVVFAFAVWHVGDFSSFYFIAGVFLFFIDRFIRMVQSQTPIPLLSARVLPSGVVELKFRKSPKLKYSALSYIFVNVPEISRFQWHPFSTTSSSLQSTSEITICIKPLGAWTKNLQKFIEAAASTNPNEPKPVGCPIALRLFAEGPYGPEKDYFLRYKTLVLVAGGIGITPFIAVVRDLLSRYQQGEQVEGLPSEVHLIWCVRWKSELAMLQNFRPALLFAGYAGGPLKIDVKTFVTREQAGSSVGNNKIAEFGSVGQEYSVTNSIVDDVSTKHNALSYVRGSNLWLAAVIAASTTGFIIFHGIFHQYIVRPNHHSTAPFFSEHGQAHAAAGPSGKAFPTWATVSLLFVSMFLGVVVCGGAALLAWAKLGNRVAVKGSANVDGAGEGNPKLADLEVNESTLLDQASVTEGTRPKLSELLYAVRAETRGDDVGVLVSGPTSMQESVATACRGYNFRNCGSTQLQFHSISFDL